MSEYVKLLNNILDGIYAGEPQRPPLNELVFEFHFNDAPKKSKED